MKNISQQRGVALLTALVFMVVITVISITAMRSSTSELRMASNAEDRIAARQVAQAAVDLTINNPLNFVVTGTEGTVKSNITLSGITEFTQTQVAVTELESMPAPRGLGVSGDKFDTTLFSINSNYDNTANARGRDELVQGFLLLVPKN